MKARHLAAAAEPPYQSDAGGRSRALLSGGGAEGRPDDSAAARLPVFLAGVRHADSTAGHPPPSHRAGFPGLRTERGAAAIGLPLHFRPSRRDDGQSPRCAEGQLLYAVHP